MEDPVARGPYGANAVAMRTGCLPFGRRFADAAQAELDRRAAAE
jgi:hypothetical protein